MQFQPTSIPDVILIEPKVFEDDRGFFMQTFQKQSFMVAGLYLDFVQENHSGSRRGVLRGLHYQIQNPQGKLVRVVAGEVFDVAVDLRKSSPTFGRWIGEVLSAANKRQLWVPAGFAHGFYVMSEWADFVYRVTDYWAPQHEKTLLWNDADLKIAWPIPAGQAPHLSAKDAVGIPLREAPVYD